MLLLPWLYIFYYNRDSAVSDSWRFDNALILVFVPLLLLVLYIDISLCSSTFSNLYCLLAWRWFFYWIFWSLLHAYHHYMSLKCWRIGGDASTLWHISITWLYTKKKVSRFTCVWLLEIRQCYNASVYTTITLLKIGTLSVLLTSTIKLAWHLAPCGFFRLVFRLVSS